MSIDVFPSMLLATLQSPLPLSQGGTGATTAANARTNLGLGTLATQDASAVAITGGSISVGGHAPTGVLDVQSSVVASDAANTYHGVRVWPAAPAGAIGLTPMRIEAATGAGLATAGFFGLYVAPQPATLASATAMRSDIAAGTNRWNIYAQGTAPNYLAGQLGIGAVAATDTRVQVSQRRDLFEHAIQIVSVGNDISGYALRFINVAGTPVGSVLCTATATTYATSSDARLKHAVTALTGALDVVAALRPVAFRWNANDEPGEGFLAHELQRYVPAAVTGEPEAVHEDGSVKPQQVDHSKLVPWLVSAIQELATRVTHLEGV